MRGKFTIGADAAAVEREVNGVALVAA